MKTLFSISFLLCLISCSEVSFPVHQPKGIAPLNTFPKELRAYYLAIESDSVRDTVVIEEKGYRIQNSKPNGTASWLDAAELSDSLVLKKYKDYYFFNFKEDNQWLLRVIKRNKNGDLTFMMLSIHDSDHDKSLTELQQELKVEVIEVSENEKYYRIDPSPSQLMSLIRKKKFWESSTLKRVK